MDAPVVDVSLAVVLVDDALHGGVVVHPGHAHIVAHDQIDLSRWNFQRLGKDGRGLRVEPHEDRDAIDRLAPQGGMDALFGVHVSTVCLGGGGTFARCVEPIFYYFEGERQRSGSFKR